MSKRNDNLLKVNIANIITGIRLVCSVLLIFCTTLSLQFYVFYITAGLSDWLDGFIARKMNMSTKLGAKLDTAADIVFTVVVLIKVIFAFKIPRWIVIVIIGVAVIKCINLLSGYIRHRRFMSEHTTLNKICGGILFVIPICMGVFPHKVTLVVMGVECVLTVIAAIQEGYFIWIGKEVE